MVVQQKPIDATTFQALVTGEEYADKRVELIAGELVEMPKPGGLHGIVTLNIAATIWHFVNERKLGQTTAAETGFVVRRSPEGKDTVRGLDVAFISYETAPEPLDAGLVTVAPDLAVEVISPGNTAGDIHRKIRELLAAGTRLVWVIYPETRTVDVHTAQGAVTLESDDTLDGGDVLPGFSLLVGDIFPA